MISSPYYYKVIPAMGYVTIEMDVDDCPGVTNLEHVSFTRKFDNKEKTVREQSGGLFCHQK